MSPSYEPELVANLERAEESIRAAKLLLGAGHFDFAASRAYYAAFYAATAVTLDEGLRFSQHKGVITATHQRFIKTGKLDKKFGKYLNRLFELRAIGDYGETQHVPAEKAQKAIETAEEFFRQD